MDNHKRSIAAGIFAGVCALAGTASAEPDPKFPLVFTSLSDLQKLGISMQWPMLYGQEIKDETPPKPGLPIGCYLYAGGNTMALISISDDFLARYKAKGFTRESLCMGLASRAKYDPETGKRLPTYMFRDDTVLGSALASLDADAMTEDSLSNFVPQSFETKEALKAGIEAVRRHDFSNLTDLQVESLMYSDASSVSEELPLKVPDCFKNGTPYLDCNWQYGLLTGKKLSAGASKKYRELGEMIDHHMQNLVAYKTWDTVDVSPYLQKRVWGLQRTFEPDNPVSTWIYEPTVGLPLGDTAGVYNGVKSVNGGEPLKFTVGGNLHLWAEEVTWFDVSPAFPRGYGYNLTANDEGFGDGGASAQSILAAFDGAASSSRFSSARLQELLK